MAVAPRPGILGRANGGAEPFERDYRKWINLQYDCPITIGPLEPEGNDFDRLTEQTRMVHNTRRKTQPWKTGLPTDWRPAERFRLFPPAAWVMRARHQASSFAPSMRPWDA